MFVPSPAQSNTTPFENRLFESNEYSGLRRLQSPGEYVLIAGP